jgi:DNA-binding NtrC family response regulator
MPSTHDQSFADVRGSDPVSEPAPVFVVGSSARMRAIVDFVKVIADSESCVLITGEAGSGKEAIAGFLHASSPHRDRPFVPVRCAVVSDSLIEIAGGGTIFFDDIDEMPMATQVKLLRVIQSRTIERPGGSRPVPVDVRIVAGSKCDVGQLVAEGKFREDLYYRLQVIPILLPPLRDRADDIPDLVEHFLARFFREHGREPAPVAPAVMRALTRYPWPGNVSELESACERMAQTCTCGTVRTGCAPAAMLFQQSVAAPARGVAPDPAIEGISLDDRLREVEASLVTWALALSSGNKSRAAKLLKIKRSTLGDRIDKLGLRPLNSPDQDS